MNILKIGGQVSISSVVFGIANNESFFSAIFVAKANASFSRKTVHCMATANYVKWVNNAVTEVYEVSETKEVAVASEVVYKTLKLTEGVVLYRGKEIELHKEVSRGFSGRYTVGSRRFITQKEAKEHIDRLCDEISVSTFMTDIDALQYKQDYYG